MLELKQYNQPMPVGVRLPEIEVDEKFYKELGIPTSASNFDLLRKLCLKGVKDRGIGSLDNKQKYYDRVKMELTVLKELGFIEYILLNWDVLNYCHESGIPTGPGRGSAAGSLVLYLLRVTNVDPIKYDLFFERFVSKSRAKQIVSDGITYLDGSLLADVDNDISYDRRKEVIKYIEKKHEGRTCKILTLNTLSSKLCIKECGKIVGELSEDDVNSIGTHIPKQFGKVAKLDKAYEESEKFKEFADKNPKVFKIAKKISVLVIDREIPDITVTDHVKNLWPDIGMQFFIFIMFFRLKFNHTAIALHGYLLFSSPKTLRIASQVPSAAAAPV